MNDRREALINLLHYSHSIEDLAFSLQQFPWDSDESCVTLTRQHIIAALNRYVLGDLTTDQVESWANAIEGREDIDYESEHEEILHEIIHQLANPLLTSALDTQQAQMVLSSIS